MNEPMLLMLSMGVEQQQWIHCFFAFRNPEAFPWRMRLHNAAPPGLEFYPFVLWSTLCLRRWGRCGHEYYNIYETGGEVPIGNAATSALKLTPILHVCARCRCRSTLLGPTASSAKYLVTVLMNYHTPIFYRYTRLCHVCLFRLLWRLGWLAPYALLFIVWRQFVRFVPHDMGAHSECTQRWWIRRVVVLLC